MGCGPEERNSGGEKLRIRRRRRRAGPQEVDAFCIRIEADRLKVVGDERGRGWTGVDG